MATKRKIEDGFVMDEDLLWQKLKTHGVVASDMEEARRKWFSAPDNCKMKIVDVVTGITHFYVCKGG